MFCCHTLRACALFFTFGDYVDHLYFTQLEMVQLRSASYLDLQLEIDSEGWLRTKFYNKRNYFNSPIVIFPFICSNMLAAPVYRVGIS